MSGQDTQEKVVIVPFDMDTTIGEFINFATMNSVAPPGNFSESPSVTMSTMSTNESAILKIMCVVVLPEINCSNIKILVDPSVNRKKGNKKSKKTEDEYTQSYEDVEIAWCAYPILSSISEIKIQSSNKPDLMIISNSAINFAYDYLNTEMESIRDRKLGNIPNLVNFGNSLPKFTSCIELPLPWNDNLPLPISSAKSSGMSVIVNIKNVNELLRVRKNGLDIPSSRLAIQDLKVTGKLIVKTMRGDELNDVLSHPKYMSSRDCYTISTHTSIVPATICKNHSIDIDLGAEQNVLAIGWNLIPFYRTTLSGVAGEEFDINNHGNYSSNPYSGGNADPIESTIISAEGINAFTQIYDGCITSECTEKLTLCGRPISRVGRHIITFGQHPLKLSSFNGASLSKIKLVCKTSDMMETALSPYEQDDLEDSEDEPERGNAAMESSYKLQAFVVKKNKLIISGSAATIQ